MGLLPTDADLATELDCVPTEDEFPSGLVSGSLQVDVLAPADVEVVVHLVEGSLFMAADIISEKDITLNLNLPPELVHDALLQLQHNYEAYDGAIQVRHTHDDCWMMCVKDEVSENVEPFYIEKKPYTRSEIMTLAFVAYAQPIPRHVLKFYRGQNTPAHVTKLESAGFVAKINLPVDDPALTEVMAKYTDDLEAERFEREFSGPVEMLDELPTEPSVEKKTRKIQPSTYACFVTTPKFAGYFNLPQDPAEMKAALETWKDIYGLLN
jgi:chromosome segregation and condensation protein ScpB